MDKQHFLELRVPPPIVFLAFAGLIWLISLYLPWATVALPASLPFALAIVAVGGLFAGISVTSFLLARTTLHPDKPMKTTTLVVSGVYSITRNPMYLSLLFVLIGWAVYLANIAALLPIPLFVSYLNRFQIRPEERVLASLFGKEYEDYTNRVRRWL